MAERIDNQIRIKLLLCVSGQISLADFRAWFVPLSWGIENCKNSEAIELARVVDEVLAESSSAKWSEDQIRMELACISRPFEHELVLQKVYGKTRRDF
jgi:hypothetical protein